MRQWIRAFFQRHAVDEVPDELAACQDCNQPLCHGEKFENCAYRLERLAALRGARTAEQGVLAPVA
jgi:hypothetical protein